MWRQITTNQAKINDALADDKGEDDSELGDVGDEDPEPDVELPPDSDDFERADGDGRCDRDLSLGLASP